MRRRTQLLAHCSPATAVPGLRELVLGLPEDERQEVNELLAPVDLAAPPGWEPVALLGRGGMGEAWLCGRGDGGLAVLKTLLPEMRANPVAQSRFRREIAATVALRHRNIVATLAADADTGWMLLEFVAGGDLRAAVKIAGPLSEADALAVAAQVAEGLAALEAARLVHRDIKPANLFVTPDGTVRIADLGLACSATPDRTRLTSPGGTVGSWRFMSPEQLAGVDDIDHRSDHFSLGATIVALMTGRAPASMREGPMTITSAERLLRPSPALRQLLARLLQPERRHRTADAAELGKTIAATIAAVGGQGSVPSLELRSTAARLDAAEDTAAMARDTLVLPATATDAAPMNEDRVLIGSARGPARWMVWSGRRLVLGKLRGGGVHLALRNYPVETHREGLEELSRRHAEIGCDAGAAWIRDLGSANGSRLDGVPLGRERHPLRPDEELVLDLAGQVLLGVRALPGGVVLRRLRNTRACGYALLTGMLELGPVDADLPWPDATAAVRLERTSGGWSVDDQPMHEGPLGGLPHAWVRPLELADLDIAEPS